MILAKIYVADATLFDLIIKSCLYNMGRCPSDHSSSMDSGPVYCKFISLFSDYIVSERVASINPLLSSLESSFTLSIRLYAWRRHDDTR